MDGKQNSERWARKHEKGNTPKLHHTFTIMEKSFKKTESKKAKTIRQKAIVKITNEEYSILQYEIENSEVTKDVIKFWEKRGIDADSFGLPLRPLPCTEPRSVYYRKRRYDQNLWLNNGTWYISYTDPKTKKRVRKSLKTKDKKNAKRLRDLILLPIGYYYNDGKMSR